MVSVKLLAQHWNLFVEEGLEDRESGRQEWVDGGIGRSDTDPVQKDEEDSGRAGHGRGFGVESPYWAVRRSMVMFTEMWPMSARSRRASRMRGSIFL